MNDMALLSAVESLRTPDSAVYTLTREKKRPFLLDLLDVVVTSGLFNSGADVADNLRSSYVLVADRSRGSIARLKDGSPSEVFEVPAWRPEWRDSFKKVTVDGYTYRRGARLA